MKTLKVIPLLILIVILAFGMAAMAQTKPADAGGLTSQPPKASPKTAPARPEIGEVMFHLDFAWKQDLLPLTEQDIKNVFVKQWAGVGNMDLATMVGGHLLSAQGGHLLSDQEIHLLIAQSVPGRPAPHRNVPCSEARYEMLQPSTMPAGLGAGWRFARVTVVFHQRIDTNEGLQWALKVRDDRAYVQRKFKRELESWLRRLDESAGLTEKLKANLREWEQEAQRRLSQLNPNEQLRQMDRQRRELEIELAGKKARGKAMEAKIAEIRKQAEAKSAADPILKELQAIAVIREEALKLLKEQRSKDFGAMTEAEVRDAQVKALEARVQVAQRQEAVAVAAGGDLLTRLTNEAAMLSIDLAEMRERVFGVDYSHRRVENERRELEMSIKKAQEEIENAKPWRIVSAPEPQVRPFVGNASQESGRPGPATREAR